MWKTVADEMRKIIQLKHLSVRTEKTYIGWVRSFYKYLKGKSPLDLNSSDVKDYMTYLAVDRKVAASTRGFLRSPPKVPSF